jgi:membrane protease YdiL (CAAX protease family)
LVFRDEPGKDGGDLMPTEPAQQILVVFELCLFLGGLGLFVWLMVNDTARRRWLSTNALPAPPIATTDFVLIAVGVFLFGITFQAITQLWFGGRIERSVDQKGLALIIYNVAIYAGALVAWKLIFPSLRRSWLVGPEAAPHLNQPTALTASQVLRYGAGALIVILPLLSLINIGWVYLLKVLEVPMPPQEAIAIFTNTRSPLVIAGMLLVACVLAPIYEELLFRAGLYRFCRQRLGRIVAMLISGLSFSALHGHVAGFVPLALLGMGLALAYEATGSIRVAIVAHGLFNLNTVLILLSGLPTAAP